MNQSPFSTACGVVVNNSYQTAGSLTRASWDILTPDEVKALYFNSGTAKWREMTAYLKTQFEMKACGVRRYGLYDWLMSSTRSGMGSLVNKVRRDRGESLIQPFIMGRQMSVVNMDYWAITNGWVRSGYTEEVTGPLTAAAMTAAGVANTDRIIRVVSRYGIELDPGWFLNRHSIYILNTLVGGTAANGEWRVLTSAAASDGTYCDVALRTQNTYDTSAVDTTPTNGIVLVGINNVNDYESWCHNPANYNPIKHVPFWYQTRRRTREIDDSYKEMLAALIDDNAWFEQFYNLPIAERNRQDELQWQKQFVNSFLFGRPISSNQTLSLWENLEQITSATGDTIDPDTGGKLIAFRANMIGIYEQMKACSRVKDLQNQAINIQEFIDTIEEVRRARSSRGQKADSIDIYAPRTMCELMEQGLINYTRARYGDILRINITPGQNEFGFMWKSFQLPSLPCTVNFIREETFDDLEKAFSDEDSGDGALASRGRMMLILDMGKGGSIYPATMATNRKVHKVGDLELLAKIDSTMACVMEAQTREVTLTSETVTAIDECPANSLWIEGVAMSTPVTTGKTSPYTDLY